MKWSHFPSVSGNESKTSASFSSQHPKCVLNSNGALISGRVSDRGHGGWRPHTAGLESLHAASQVRQAHGCWFLYKKYLQGNNLHTRIAGQNLTNASLWPPGSAANGGIVRPRVITNLVTGRPEALVRYLSHMLARYNAVIELHLQTFGVRFNSPLQSVLYLGTCT